MSNDLVNRLRGIGERIPVPCPDGIKGCLVFHYRVETNPVCAKAADRIERLEAALSTADSWLDRWAVHVGNCEGENTCTCGLTNARYEARAALGESK